jgi:uncharacterized metal-binding protein
MANEYSGYGVTCEMCGVEKQTYSEMKMSQGRTVCSECKELWRKQDEEAYDRYVTMGRL